jgi:hypothetical protein
MFANESIFLINRLDAHPSIDGFLAMGALKKKSSSIRIMHSKTKLNNYRSLQ